MIDTTRTEVIKFLRPNAEFALRGDDLEWLDTKQSEPTLDEIEKGFDLYAEYVKKNKEEQAAKREALLARLGITEEEARLLLG